MGLNIFFGTGVEDAGCQIAGNQSFGNTSEVEGLALGLCQSIRVSQCCVQNHSSVNPGVFGTVAGLFIESNTDVVVEGCTVQDTVATGQSQGSTAAIGIFFLTGTPTWSSGIASCKP